MNDTQEVGARLLGIGLLAAVALVLLGFITGSHGLVDSIAIIAGALALFGGAMWCMGLVMARRARR